MALSTIAVVLAPLCAARAQTSAIEASAPLVEPTNSLMARAVRAAPPVSPDAREEYHALRAMSMFAVPPPEPRRFALHDLVQVIVLESTTARSSQSLEAMKDYELDGRVNWPDFRLSDLLNLQVRGQSSHIPVLEIDGEKDFKSDGEYERRDDLTSRITAEVVEILPNGNLIVEARRSVQTDEERSVLKVTGMCRPEDVTAVNTILSNQLHDLTIEIRNEGELKRTSEKGILARVLDAIFAF